MVANILTLPLSAFDEEENGEETKQKYRERHSLIIDELAKNKITARFWYGERPQFRIENAISRSHKLVIRHHQHEFPNTPCWVIEDDTHFLGPESVKYYLDHIPDSFDLYLGMISGGNIDENNETQDFSCLGCYIIHPRFMNKFLLLSEQKDLDRELTDRTEGKLTPKGKFVVCDKFVAVSHNVYSLHFNEVKDYSNHFKGRPLYGTT